MLVVSIMISKLEQQLLSSALSSYAFFFYNDFSSGISENSGYSTP